MSSAATKVLSLHDSLVLLGSYDLVLSLSAQQLTRDSKRHSGYQYEQGEGRGMIVDDLYLFVKLID